MPWMLPLLWEWGCCRIEFLAVLGLERLDRRPSARTEPAFSDDRHRRCGTEFLPRSRHREETLAPFAGGLGDLRAAVACQGDRHTRDDLLQEERHRDRRGRHDRYERRAVPAIERSEHLVAPRIERCENAAPVSEPAVPHRPERERLERRD